uniref:4-hydroxy-3-methylbut-2-enyl diphosphate reductase n=3 Tax=Rhodosorus marinus TaxID=101924 RepID=A0A7S3EKB2_9RHOD|mmetsp:Transcript_39603/g.157313  ORF Transcript_39603/g.157313 Transcript_39603/m.157313 type:complete len:380 (+) Transcript_39603:177-1316(+)
MAFIGGLGLRLGAGRKVEVSHRGGLRMAVEEDVSKRARRREIVTGKKFNRKGFRDESEEVGNMLNSEFTSDLLKEIRALEHTYERDGVTIRLAKAYGFCWGVERAVAIAYETRSHFPTQKIWLTNEIIHNPMVNNRLADMGVFFIPQENMKKDFSEVQGDDVVVLPAFGATLEEMQYLKDLGCQVVDTTCPWVSKVWTALDKHTQRACTSIIHGKWKHEETIATSSFAEKYLIVLNMKEAEYVSNYILNGGDKEEFRAKFKNAMSDGFDPDVDLKSVGVANQTTMLKSETEEMAKYFEKTMMKKYGPQNLNDHYVAFNTICDATQERQDAMIELMDEELDMVLVVGGFNSSNTSHLQELAEHGGFTSYWVNEPTCIGMA